MGGDQDETVNFPPSFRNLPTTKTGQLGEADEFSLEATDADGHELSFQMTESLCDFEVEHSGSIVFWTCPNTNTTCSVEFEVEDELGLTDSGTLTIQCAGSVPSFQSITPTMATEHETLRYPVECSSDELAVMFSVSTEDTCGGLLEGDEYVWTPGELQGGETCVLQIECATEEFSVTQTSNVMVQEVNAAPRFLNLPASEETPWGRTGSLRLTALDSDIPKQDLEFTVESSTCNFSVLIPNTDLVTWSCGSTLGTCDSVIVVSDGETSVSESLQITCTNSPPTVDNVSITATAVMQPNQPLTCEYDFIDGDGDEDESEVNWIIDGIVVFTGEVLTTYEEGDQINCEVTPKDGASEGAAVSSSTLIVPTSLKIAVGHDHVCVRTPSSAVRCWGSNAYGEVGAPNISDGVAHTPRTVPGLTSGVTDIGVGFGYGCAVQNGALKCWGNYSTGILGPTVTESTPNPVTVLASNVTRLSAGYSNACAVHNQALKCWGTNLYGEAGNTVGVGNALVNASTPTTVAGYETGVTKFGVGLNHTCALKNGEVKCWGQNFRGQLGVATNYQTGNANPTPVSVAGLSSGVTDLWVGGEFNCALHNGILKCWGSNVRDQLGRNAGLSSHNPAPPTGLMGQFSMLAVGEQNVCVVQNGLTNCWGSNVSEQVTLGTETSFISPQTSFMAAANVIGIGPQNICIEDSNILYCRGGNDFGQIGNGIRDSGFTNYGPTAVTY